MDSTKKTKAPTRLEKTFTLNFIEYAKKSGKFQNQLFLKNLQALWILFVIQFFSIIGAYTYLYFKASKALSVVITAISVLPFILSISFLIIELVFD
jgi:hypothetical protein